MKLNEFINNYINTKVDFDGAFGAQCVDLFRQYCKDVLNIPHTGSVEGAKDLYCKWEKLPLEKKYFRKIPIDNLKEIIYGDVIIWDSTQSNKYGHVAIALAKIDIKNILVFEQNGIKRDGAKIAIKPLDNMLGVLRFDWSEK